MDSTSNDWFRKLTQVNINPNAAMVRCKVADCPKRFVDGAEASQHFKTHESVFCCSECNVVYKYKENLYCHFDSHNIKPEKKVVAKDPATDDATLKPTPKDGNSVAKK